MAIDFGTDVNRERPRGFQNAQELYDLRQRPELLVPLAYLLRENGCLDQTFTSIAARPVAAQWEFAHIVDGLLKLPEPPTALFCFDYETAVLAVRALVQLGFTPGKQVSVVGFDAPNSVCVSRITSAIQPAGEIGALAAELLLERIGDQRAKPRSVRLSAQLVPGDTSGPPIQP